LRAIRVSVRGRVQRVGYRRFILDLAQELGVSGYVKNLPDGSVELYAQGENTDLSRFIELVKSPPPPAHVTRFEIREAKPNPRLKLFRIIYGRLTEELQEGFGAMQSIFLDYWGEFRSYREEFRDYREEFRDYRKEFRDFRDEFRDYRQEFREFSSRTDESFRSVLEKYGEISEKLTAIMNTLIEESKKTREMLEVIKTDSRETRLMLTEALTLLREAVERIQDESRTK